MFASVLRLNDGPIPVALRPMPKYEQLKGIVEYIGKCSLIYIR